MSFETQTSRIEQLISLVKSNNTGTADELAKKMGVSRRTIFKDIDFLRGRGLTIKFDLAVKSYLLEKN